MQNRKAINSMTVNGRAMDDQALPRFLKRNQLAERWGVNPRTIDLWRRAGRIPAVNLGGTRTPYFRLSDIEAIEAERYAKVGATA
jgi:hypothetical protein